MSALLAAIYLQGGMAILANPIKDPSGYDYQHVINPYGQFEVGIEHEVGRWSFALYGRHISSVASSRDNGADTLELSVKVHPFR